MKNKNWTFAPLFKFGSKLFRKLSLKKVITKTVKEANIDDNEEYLNINDTVIQVNINRMPRPYEKLSNIPK